MADNLRLVILTFPQRWDPATATLSANVVLIPSVSPLDDPLLGGTSAAFADHLPTLRARAIASLDQAPVSTGADIPLVPVIRAPSPLALSRPVFRKLATRAASDGVTITGSGALTAPSQSRIRKALPQSYLDATGARPNGITTTTTDDFGCAIRATPPVPPGPKPTVIGWGPIISYALRQPLLANALGLRYETELHLADPKTFENGGWLFFQLDAADPWATAATPGQIRLYAARLPALTSTPRPIFAAVLFPVDSPGIADAAFGVAETYDGGFAQVVHAHQPQANSAVVGDGELPAASDAGIQLGWDDEQVVAWQNGQIQILNDRIAGSLNAQTPLGVLGYRIDVADLTFGSAPPAWHSLVRAVTTLPEGLGRFDGELTVEPTALRPLSADPAAGEAWLPRYFANWRGRSLVAADEVVRSMLDHRALTVAPDPIGVLLSYGHSYAFRVRLADLSSGGPALADEPVNTGPADVASLTFFRAIPPKQPKVDPAPTLLSSSPPPDSLTFFRPLIGYPEVLYTALGANDADRRAISTHFINTADPGSGAVVGLPDPDVETLELIVSVRAPAHDIAGDGTLDPPYRELYRTTRPYPVLPAGGLPADPGLPLDLAYVDASSIIDWDTTQPATGPLVLPRARDLRITARALTRIDPSYFSPAATRSLPTSFTLRAEALSEPALLISPVDGDQNLRGFFFQRPPGIKAPPVAAHLAQELRALVDGLTLSAPLGRRIVFGASKSVRHTLSGDCSALTFAAESELRRQWLVVLMADLDRDWTWDGLANAHTITIERDEGPVGSIVVEPTLGAAALHPEHWDRRRTRLIFFDGVDPHEKTASGFPEALVHAWKFRATLNATGSALGVAGVPALKPDAVVPPAATELNKLSQTLTMPIAIPPAQIPEIASVGLAFSPYTIGPGYASTGARQRALWIEIKAPIDNSEGDALFARVLAHGADPLLYDADPAAYNEPSAAGEPPLVLDPEFIRSIFPGDSDNRSGLQAMTRLEPATDSPVHFLLPLPDGIDPADPELFGFYSYELRIGHAGQPGDRRWWSTASARFGRPLRVNGVQHPAPGLVCRAGRLPDATAPASTAASSYIRVTAPYATPTLHGAPLVRHGEHPKTTLFFFLYAQVVQADAAANRNILLFQREGQWEGLLRQTGAITGPARFGAAPSISSGRDRLGLAFFSQAEVEKQLLALGLPLDLPLSILAVEFLPRGFIEAIRHPTDHPRATDPSHDILDLNGAPRRILRVSPLVPIGPLC